MKILSVDYKFCVVFLDKRVVFFFFLRLYINCEYDIGKLLKWIWGNVKGGGGGGGFVWNLVL